MMLSTHHRISSLTGLPLWILMWMMLAGVNASPREINPQTSVLADLVIDLLMAGEEVQRAFSRIALDELTAAYQVELNQMGRTGNADTKSVKKQKKRRRWSSATNSFIAELMEASRLLYFDAPLKLYVDRQQSVLLVIGGRSIAVSGPRIGRTEEFEQRIVDRFCSYYDCLKPEQATSHGVPEQEFSAPGSWLLGQNLRPGYMTKDGLLFEFKDATDRVVKSDASLAVIVELRKLAEALKRFQHTGGSIDWKGLAIKPAPASEGQRVIVNSQGDYIRLRLPNLDRHGSILHEAMPWLHARVEEALYQLKIRDADRLLQ